MRPRNCAKKATRAKILEVEKRKALRPRAPLAATPMLCDFFAALIQMNVVQTVLKLQTIEPMRSHSLRSTLSIAVPNCVRRTFSCWE